MNHPSETTKAQALGALDGMRSIVRSEMLVAGTYIDPEITNPRRVDSLCGGRKHCAVGSLWVAAGVKPETRRNPYTRVISVHLPGVLTYQRYGFLRHRPGLRLAYNMLNEVAWDYAVEKGIDWISDKDNALEELFEGAWDTEELLTKRDLLQIIASAKRKVIRA